jgi:hypothetical protein
VDEEQAHGQMLVVPVPDPDSGAPVQGPHWKAQQKILWAEVSKETGRTKNRFKFRDPSEDERSSRAILAFFATADLGRRLRRIPRVRCPRENLGNGKRRRRSWGMSFLQE